MNLEVEKILAFSLASRCRSPVPSKVSSAARDLSDAKVLEKESRKDFGVGTKSNNRSPFYHIRLSRTKILYIGRSSGKQDKKAEF
jgi:hypothetical protein